MPAPPSSAAGQWTARSQFQCGLPHAQTCDALQGSWRHTHTGKPQRPPLCPRPRQAGPTSTTSMVNVGAAAAGAGGVGGAAVAITRVQRLETNPCVAVGEPHLVPVRYRPNQLQLLPRTQGANRRTLGRGTRTDDHTCGHVGRRHDDVREGREGTRARPTTRTIRGSRHRMGTAPETVRPHAENRRPCLTFRHIDGRPCEAARGKR
jgi:hypothetical protein